jgi:hypothetical protein
MPTGPYFFCFDDGDALLEVEGVDRDIADISDAQGIERCRPRRHVVGPDEAGFSADLPRSEAGAGAVGGSDIERDPDKRRIQSFRRRQCRQTHHGRWAAETRHLVAAERLMKGLVHV